MELQILLLLVLLMLKCSLLLAGVVLLGALLNELGLVEFGGFGLDGSWLRVSISCFAAH